MSTYDPRIVVQALEDLEGELTRWSSIASDMLASASETQRHAKEAVERAFHDAAVTVDRANDDKDNVERVITAVNNAIDKCSMAITTAKGTVTASQNALSQSSTTLQKWQAELDKALAWLARAETRLARAIQELGRAQNALRSAQWDLSSAQSRLRNCQNDEDRRDCSSEAAAVNRAAAAVSRAQQWVYAAEREKHDAEVEVDKAKARVACCKQAVAFSSEAVSLAQESVSAATQAVNSAERSLEFARAAESLVSVAQKNSLAEIEAAENMMTETRGAQDFTDNAATQLRNADAAEDSAQTYSASVRKELTYRIQQLLELNRPSLFDSGGWSLSSSTHQTGTTLKQDYLRNVSLQSQQISLADIEDISFDDLSQGRLDMLQHGHDSFEKVLASDSSPIALDKGSGKPYKIIDGRHRIYLARQKGLSSVPIKFV